MGDHLNLRKKYRGSRQIILRRHFVRRSRSRHESIKSMVAVKRQHMKSSRLRSWLRQRGVFRRLVRFDKYGQPLLPRRRPKGHRPPWHRPTARHVIGLPVVDLPRRRALLSYFSGPARSGRES